MRSSLLILMFISVMLCLTTVYASQSYQDPSFRDANINRPYSHWDLNQFQIQTNPMDDYFLQKKIGAGTFGTVYKTTHLPTGKTYAFKQLMDLYDWDMKKEIKVMQELADAPNVLPIRDIVMDEDENGEEMAGLIVDFFPTENYKTSFQKLTKTQIKRFIYQTLETLAVAHSRGIAHRDIKPLNVLMNLETNEAKVIDWGLSEYYRPGVNYDTDVSTIFFKSPELLMEYRNFDYALDIWSTGCMLGEMVFMKDHLFRANYYSAGATDYDNYEVYNRKKLQIHREQLDKIAQLLGTAQLKEFANKFQNQMDMNQLKGIPDYEKVPFFTLVNERNEHLYDPKVDDLLEKMLSYDHTKRITAAEALLHPYFDEVRNGMPIEEFEQSVEDLYEQYTAARAVPGRSFRIST